MCLDISGYLNFIPCQGMCYTEYEGQTITRGCLSSKDVKDFFNNFFTNQEQRDQFLSINYENVSISENKNMVVNVTKLKTKVLVRSKDEKISKESYERYMMDVHGYRKLRLCKSDKCNKDENMILRRTFYEPLMKKVKEFEKLESNKSRAKTDDLYEARPIKNATISFSSKYRINDSQYFRSENNCQNRAQLCKYFEKIFRRYNNQTYINRFWQKISSICSAVSIQEPQLLSLEPEKLVISKNCRTRFRFLDVLISLFLLYNFVYI